MDYFLLFERLDQVKCILFSVYLLFFNASWLYIYVLLLLSSVLYFILGKNKFSYRVGTIYEYTYETETKTGIQGATEEQGGLKVTATAEIEVLSKCELLLTVS